MQEEGNVLVIVNSEVENKDRLETLCMQPRFNVGINSTPPYTAVQNPHQSAQEKKRLSDHTITTLPQDSEVFWGSGIFFSKYLNLRDFGGASLSM